MMQEHDREGWERLGQWLKRRRKARGYTVTRLAREAGVAYQSIVTLEQGGYRQTADGDWTLPNPKDETLRAVATAVGADIEDCFALVGRYDERRRTRQSLRRGSGKQNAAARIDKLERRVEELERRFEELSRGKV